MFQARLHPQLHLYPSVQLQDVAPPLSLSTTFTAPSSGQGHVRGRDRPWLRIEGLVLCFLQVGKMSYVFLAPSAVL